jgi:PadR family transcriptional regulator, regulatory protein PadR
VGRTRSSALFARRNPRFSPRTEQEAFRLFWTDVDVLLVLAVECPRPMKPNAPQYQNRVELIQGTLDMLILQTLQWGPQHGYGIVQALRLNSGDVLQVETGSLYPALHRLERQDWVRSEWKQTESKQRARYYRITASGKKQLVSETSRWDQMVEAIGAVMRGSHETGEA